MKSKAVRFLEARRARTSRSRARALEYFVPGNRVQYHCDADRALEAMLAAIVEARREILLEMYWFDSDRTGRRFLDALAEAARRGVRVSVIYDWFGSLGTESRRFEEVRRAGAQVVAFNRVRWVHHRAGFERLTRRNHRKLLAVDGRLAFVGGVNLADAWASRERGGLQWRDDLLEVEGPVLLSLRDRFFRSLSVSGESPAWPLEAPDATPRGSIAVAVLTQNTRRQHGHALHAYLRRIGSARRSVLLANAYFVPIPRVARALATAARRGVEVSILLPGSTDVPLVSDASRATWTRLLAAGVTIAEYQGSVLHAKTAVVDSRWVTTGSFNLDHLSIRANRELNLSVEDTSVAREVERRLRADFDGSTRITLAEFRKRSRWSRLLERGAYALRRWM